jgi:hypothetical protein
MFRRARATGTISGVGRTSGTRSSPAESSRVWLAPYLGVGAAVAVDATVQLTPVPSNYRPKLANLGADSGNLVV